MKKLCVAGAVFFLLTVVGAQAGEIQLYFPHFAGHAYDWKLFQGETEVTVRSGEIDPDGRVTLIMPDTYREYRGMTRWMLRTGGGLDMIYAGNGFSVECLSEHPGSENIIYTGNPENDYLKQQHNRQQTIMDRMAAVAHFLQVYPAEHDLHLVVSGEQESLRREFEQVQVDRAASLFYAARFGEIVDFTKGVADRIYENPADHTLYFNDFITHTLNFEDLYTSGHWDQVCHHWLMMNLRSEAGTSQFQNRIETVLGRMDRDEILAAFGDKAVLFLVQQGKDELLPVLASRLAARPDAGAAVSGSTQNMLASFKVLIGQKAPDIVLRGPVRTGSGWVSEDIILETGKLNADHTLLLFYQGECPLCEDALIALANGYTSLAARNVRVIALSGDSTEKGFEKKLAYHQWPDNYCDLTGMAGDNFKNYAVMGVPTLYLIDREGTVLEKTASADVLIRRLSR